MKRLVISADSHIVEPPDLLSSNLPANMRAHGIRTEIRGEHRCTVVGERVIHRMRIAPVPVTMEAEVARSAGGGGAGRDAVAAGAGMETWRRDRTGEKPLRRPQGAVNIEARLKDMADDGIDAEIVFGSTSMFSFGIEDVDTELATCQIYNDWHNKTLGGRPDKFIRCGVLPVRDFRNTVAEMERLSKLGFTAAMLPIATQMNIPKYNDPVWDEVFHAGGELGICFVMHTATGLDHIVHERGAGGAVINYTRQLGDGAEAVTYLAAGGVMDRNPKSRVAIIEAGASWLPAVAERMDEVYDAHYSMVRPKLTRMPSEIVRDQIKASFQTDRACIIARNVVGTGAFLWAADYPHAEGTFPNSQMIIERLFEGIDITEEEKADILGLNAARLFRLPLKEALAA